MINPPTAANPNIVPDLLDARAINIYVGVDGNAPQPLPTDQRDLAVRFLNVLRSVQQLYRAEDATSSARDKLKFRRYFVRIFRLAQLGVEGANVAPDMATAALNQLVGDLIDDEAGHVKNKHMRVLGGWALVLAIPFSLAYGVIKIVHPTQVDQVLQQLEITPDVFGNFMLAWMGCFLGVWLSYGIRTTTFTIADLTLTDADRLVPVMRLLFAGFLTMLLGLVFAIPVLEVKIGTTTVTSLTSNPMLAFLVGSFCGISELLLPTVVAKRAADFISNIK